MDSSFEKTRDVVLSWYKRKLDDLPTLVSQQNPKGALQELAAKHGDKIEYKLLSQTGPDHSKVFEVEVRIGGKTYAKASASSKKSAETKAARASIKEYAAECARADSGNIAQNSKSKAPSAKKQTSKFTGGTFPFPEIPLQQSEGAAKKKTKNGKKE